MADLPPSYNEVVDSTVQRNQLPVTPSAPRLESADTDLQLSNAHVQLQEADTGVSYIQGDAQFKAWNDNATRILILNRLLMNKKFEQAQTQQELDDLWNAIRDQLIAAGYTFALIDVIQYWEFEFYIYKSIINNLTAGLNDGTNWKYYALMDNVFKYSTRVSKSQTQDNNAATYSSPTMNILDSISNRRSIEGEQYVPLTITSQPNPVSNGVENEIVVTTQPQSINRPTAVPPRSKTNDDDEEDCCCCCTIGRPSGYSGGGGGGGGGGGYSGYSRGNTGYSRGNTGYSRGYNSNYDNDTGGFTDDYNRGYTNIYTGTHTADDNNRDDRYCYTRDNDDNCCAVNRDDDCCDTRNDDRGCHDSGRGHSSGGHYSSSHDTGGGGYHSSSHNSGGGYHSSTHDSGGDYHSSSHNSGGGYHSSSHDSGGGHHSSSHDSGGGGGDYGCSSYDSGGGGGGDDGGGGGGDDGGGGGCDD